MGIGVVEEHHPLAEIPVCPEHAQEQTEYQCERGDTVAAGEGEEAGVGTGDAAQTRWIAVLQLFEGGLRRGRVGRRLAEKGAEYGAEEQGVEQRAREHREHGHGQVAHELAGDAGPENQRQEGGERRGR